MEVWISYGDSILIFKLEAEAKEAYATVKDSISIDEEGFVRNYKDLITNKGLNKEEAIEEIKMLYDKEIEQETTETPTEKPVEKPVESGVKRMDSV